MNIIKVFHLEELINKCTAVKLFRYPCPPSLLIAIFSHLLRGCVKRGFILGKKYLGWLEIFFLFSDF